MLRVVETYFISFLVYSFFGWVWESVFCSLWKHKRLINRGFLNGPYCPIYGWGAILDLLMLGRIDNIFSLFFISGVLTCVLEYFTSVIMEKMFATRWWDYSDMKFNIQGRVCLLGFIAFGLFSIVLIEYIDPFVVSHINRLSPMAMNIIAAAAAVLFMADNIITFTGFSGFDGRLKEFSDSLEEQKEKITAVIQSKLPDISKEDIRSRLPEISGDRIREQISKAFNWQQKRILRAFPTLRSIKYDGALKLLRSSVLKNHQHKK
ncbi:MAG: putative ABC transporter permease [Clostridia bacterium]|nr:putative ABC transporter permease [Clostridia bacterium]